MSLLPLLLPALLTAVPLEPGDTLRKLEVDGRTRSYYVHIPPKSDPLRPKPVVLALHGAATNGPIMAMSTGISRKADLDGFVAVYPNGTGKGELLLVWNAGGFGGRTAERMPDDVKFIDALLDDLATVVNIDSRRIYATGMSNGGMMCYRLAAELSHPLAAIAPVAGTMTTASFQARRPVPVLHVHGTQDKLVPWNGAGKTEARFLAFRSVDETIAYWVKADGCPPTPEIVELPDAQNDGTTVRRLVYGPGQLGSEVILCEVREGGHTWPGRAWPIAWLGKTCHDISATDQIWDFFQKHPLPVTQAGPTTGRSPRN
jgi:polyhydroxybutyrate depolymerase